MPLAPQAAPAHARRTYVPEENRAGTALCLSGGGFRAALFHLGAVRRLYELGILEDVRTIVAVSGGSMFAAFLADRRNEWFGQALDAQAWEAKIASWSIAVPSSFQLMTLSAVGWTSWPVSGSLASSSWAYSL